MFPFSAFLTIVMVGENAKDIQETHNYSERNRACGNVSLFKDTSFDKKKGDKCVLWATKSRMLSLWNKKNFRFVSKDL